MSVFLPSLKASGHLDKVYMTVVNVGSRKLSTQDDYASAGWGIFAPYLTIYGFDADEDAAEAANADLENRQITWTEKHIPLALSNSIKEQTLYVTKNPMCSSLYPPNEPFLGRFAQLPELVNLDFTIEIETTTLDAFCQQEGIKTIDFLQIDVQGADLQVLQGATEILNSVQAIQIEVEFSPLYLNQPLFADVDTCLRGRGFSLFDIYCAHRLRANSPIKSNTHAGQLLWGDAFYFRDTIGVTETTPEQLFKLACIADVMEFTDYALELLVHLTLTYGSDPKYNYADNILQSLAQFPQLVNQGLESLPVVTKLRDRFKGEF